MGCGNSVQDHKLKYILRNLPVCHHKNVSSSTGSVQALGVKQGVSRLFPSAEDDVCCPKNAQHSRLWIIVDIILFSVHGLTAGCTRARCSEEVLGIPVLAVCSTQCRGLEVPCQWQRDLLLELWKTFPECSQPFLKVAPFKPVCIKHGGHFKFPCPNPSVLHPTDMCPSLEPQLLYIFVAPLTGMPSAWTITNYNDIKVSKQHLPEISRDRNYHILSSPVMLGLFSWFLCPTSCMRKPGWQRSD